MPTYTKFLLSASVNGRGVLLSGTTSGTTTPIHTATNAADTLDEVYLYGVNHGSALADVTLELGGTTSGDRLEVGIPPQQGLVALVPGFCYSGGVVIAGFASTASGVTIHGFVNRIDQSA